MNRPGQAQDMLWTHPDVGSKLLGTLRAQDSWGGVTSRL